MARMDKALAIAEARAEKAMKGKVLTMPLWPEDLVGTPNVLVRNALFGVVRHAKAKDRPMAVQELVASVKGPKESVRVWFTGFRLNQTDLDFFECVLQLAGQNDVEYVTLESGQRMMIVTSYQLLKMLNRHKGANARTYQSLDESMLRLREGAVRVFIQREGMKTALSTGGPLILHAREDAGNLSEGRHLVAVNPMLQPLFAPGYFSLINLPLRISLKKDLSKWLLCFYSTHARPIPHSFGKLQELCGSQMANSTAWRNSVIRAHEELVEVGFLKSYEVDAKGNVSVERAREHVTLGQLKALEPKKASAAVGPRQESLL